MVYIFLADGFEEIEALSVVDILRRAEIDIKMVSIADTMVTGAHGIAVKADCLIDDIMDQKPDMAILPGGMPGTANLEKSEKLQEILGFMVKSNKWVAAICAAPMILGNKGYLEDMNVICYPGYEKYLKGAVIRDHNVNVCRNIITSKGAGTAGEFAFTLVSILKNDDIAHSLKVQMQYPL